MDTSGISFGPFHLPRGQRKLTRDGEAVSLHNRALDLLIVLAMNAGQVVSKKDLIDSVWGDADIDEANLRVHVSELRKALGKTGSGTHYIANVTGRGYCLVEPVHTLPDDTAAAYLPISGLSGAYFGLDSTIAKVRSLLSERRLVTVVGPGGIGKTTAAHAVSNVLKDSFEQGICFVDFAAVTDGALLAERLAGALGLAVFSRDALKGILAFLANRKMLIVFDNCERVIDAATELAEELVVGTQLTRVLATSREPLRAAGESVFRLASMPIPPHGRSLTAAMAMTYPSVQLFINRSNAASRTLEFDDDNAAVVAEICRRLDGIPLAIEMAAANVDVFGIAGLASSLNDRLALLTRGRRTALPHHQTLRATLDWSYTILSPSEQTLLCRLAVFAGTFAAVDVVEIASDDILHRSSVLECLASLAEKSLVSVRLDGSDNGYRLLETTREYALEKLQESEDHGGVCRLHAVHFCNFFREADSDWVNLSKDDWRSKYAGRVDDARAGIDWAFESPGNTAIGVALTISIASVLKNATLWEECRLRTVRALTALDQSARQDDVSRMRLGSAMALALMHTAGVGPELLNAWQRVREIAAQIGDTDHELRACLGLWITRPPRGHHLDALGFATEFRDIASSAGLAADKLVGQKLMGSSYFILGEHSKAEELLESVLAKYVRRQTDTTRFQSDQLVTGKCYFALNLWVQGFPDRALLVADSNTTEASSLGHPASHLFSLLFGLCPVAIYTGNVIVAERGIALLSELGESSERWSVWHQYYQGMLAVRTGQPTLGASLLQLATIAWEESNYHFLLVPALAEWATASAASGDPRSALATIGKAMDLADRNGERWIEPELLRVNGDLLLLQGDASGERYLRDAIGRARAQGALSWELRAATSLATYCRAQGRTAEALDLLDSVYGRFTEGFATVDLVCAMELRTEMAKVTL